MYAVNSPHHSWSFEDRLHIDANGSNGSQPEYIQITLLQMQLEVPLIRDEVNGDLLELRDSLRREIDELNREVDKVRVGQLDMSHMIKDLRNHFFSMQPVYVKATIELTATEKKMRVFTSVFGVLAVVGVVLIANQYL